ncbi:MAG TPA: hypothetical protein VD907_06960 [Verrucomicrobiae bacterium]|nr:hypothetical protein [Verrucomicrobiae bacterium]
MAVTDPVKVKGAAITSSDFVSFDAGLDERGEYNIAPNALNVGRNARVNSAGNATKRLSKKRWLPDSVGFNGEASGVYYNGQLYYFIADDGKVKWAQENDTAWHNCGGDNDIDTAVGVITTFLRVNDLLLCMNGQELRYIDLATFNMVKFTFVANPVSVLTCTPSGITGTGPFNVWYAITYNSNGGGETAIGPIKQQAVSKSRSTWKEDGTEYLTIAFNDTPPVGATSRNLYAAIALQGTTPVASDLAMLKSNIPIGDTSFVDNGQIPFDISYNTAPDSNSTKGIKATGGTIVDKTPVLYGDPDNPYDIYFGALTDTGVSFGSNNGAQRLPLLKGTNYYPTSVIGFRNNQNVPNLLALFTSTEGIAKQQILSQKTLSYGNATVTYWAADELNAGASAVYSKYGVISYLGELQFPSADGITSLKTEQELQNVLSPSIVSDAISKSYGTIKNANFDKIVGTAWNNLVAWAVPSRGYNYNNQIFVRDLTNRQKPKWAIWDLPADWIGTVSPHNRDSFMYIRQGNKFFKLVESYVAEDEKSDGTSEPYPVVIEGSLRAFSEGRNVYMAVSQAVLYLGEFIGTVDIEITYINAKGRPKRKSKRFTNGAHGRNMLAGWGNPRLLFRSFNNRVIGWSTPMPTSGQANNTQKITKRCRIKLPNPVVNEAKFKVSGNLTNTSFDVVKGNFEGVNIGVIGDIV